MAKKNYDDDLFITTQVFSSFQWNKDESKQRRFSANMLNQNGFICFIQGRSKKGNFSNITNFYCRFDDLPILEAVIRLVLEDIEKGKFNKERKMTGNKTNISFPIREKDDKVYVGVKITKNDSNGNETSNSETILLESRNEGEVKKGVEQLRAFKNSIHNTYYRTSTSYDQHFKKYFEAKDGDGNSNSGSSGSNKSRPKPEDDDDFPFDN